MSNESRFDGSWDRVSAELRACKEAQRRAYGDVDSATLGRYLAGDMAPEERQALERTLDELPELRKLTDLVQDVLGDLEPLSETPAAAVPAPAPVLLSFASATSRPRRKPSPLHRYLPLAAAACLLVVLGVLMPRPSFLTPTRNAPISFTDGFAKRTGGGEAAGLAMDTRMVFLEPPAQFQGELAGDSSKDQVPAPQFRAPPIRGSKQAPAPIDQAVAFFHERGEVARAEQTLRAEYESCRKKLGPDDRKTRWAGRQLAGVYQYALNFSEDGPLALAPAPPPGVPGAAQVRATNTARAVRDRIGNQRPAQVKVTVVPVLTEALVAANTAEERLALTSALGRLGPAARPAVPHLCKRLQESDDPQERKSILVALDRMGPAAQDATSTLALLLDSADKAKVFAKGGEKDGPLVVRVASKDEARARLTPSEKKLAQQIHDRLTGREARVGVFDSAGLFSLKSNIEATQTLRELARESLLEVRVETLADEKKAVQPPPPKPWAIQVVFAGGRAVKVVAGQAVREQGFDPDRLASQLTEQRRKQQNETALNALVEAAKAVKQVEKK